MSSLPNEHKDFVAVSIDDSSVSYPPSSKLYCNLCSCNLILIDAKTEEWFCNRCNVSYFPNRGEKVKRASKFEIPSREDNVLVSIVEDSPKAAPRKSVFPRSLEGPKRTGVNITSLSSTVDNEGVD
jgi:hypothetical protein